MSFSTIFAVSSGTGRAGVAVIRVSGPAAGFVLAGLAPGPCPPRQATLRRLRDPATAGVIDDALVLWFPAPGSFTGEDVVEFHVHGSSAVVRKMLACLSRFPDCGAASAGEFTRRAFLNGKMDLLDVEALGDLLSAETVLQRRLAIDGSTSLRSRVSRWHDRLLGLRAITEAYIDFADEGDVSDRIDSETEQEIRDLADDIGLVERQSLSGERIRAGFRVAILGPPNAGKSSLLNALADRDVAITSPIPGTTRDVLDAHIDLDGLPVILSDSAGIRETSDIVEAEGVRRARLAADTADLVIWANPIDSPAECPDPGFLEIRTKADLAIGPVLGGLAVSVTDGTGVQGLVSMIREKALEGDGAGGFAGIAANARQVEALRAARRALTRAVDHPGYTLDLRAEELRIACDHLDAIIGRIHHDAVLGSIFARFCIGK